jgi:parallel beta-helix repeat protein
MGGWITGDVSGSETLTSQDHLYESHINQLRESNIATAVVGRTILCHYYCDGAADDVQIQEAIDAVYAAGGGEVRIKTGTYQITAEITIYPGVIIRGDGGKKSLLDASAFSVANSNKYIFVSTDTAGKEDFIIENLGFKCFFTDGTGSTYAVKPATSGILINNARRVWIRGCYFESCWNATTIGYSAANRNDSAGALNIKQVMFENNVCYDCLGGLQGYAEESVIWNANQFEDVGDDAVAFLGAVNSDPHSSKAVISNNIMKNGRVTNSNGVVSPGVFAKLDGGGFGAENVVNASITGNVVEDAYISFYLANASKVVIDGNVINNSYFSGIYMSGGNKKTVISNNQIENANSSANASHAGILSTGAEDISIHGNQIIGAANGGKQGIVCQGSFSRVSINNNQVKDSSGFSIYAETGTDVVINNNLLSGSQDKGIQISAANAEVHNNNMAGSYTSSKIAFGTVSNVSAKNNLGFNPELLYAVGNSGAALTIDRVNGDHQTVTMTANCTFTFTAGKVKGDLLILELTQDGTGSRTATWPSNFKKAGGTLTLTVTAGATDVITARWNGTNWVEVSRALSVS